MPISLRTGPFTTIMLAKEVVELGKEGRPEAPRARMTGKCSGRAPAMTAMTASLSTVYLSRSSWVVTDIMPTHSSGLWSVPVSISATRSSVGRMIGRPSVQPLSRKRRWRFSSVSGSRRRGQTGLLKILGCSSASVRG